MAASYASPETAQDANWYPDSGASSHITPNIGNLMTKTDYFGSNHVQIGNGMYLPIKLLVILL